MMKLATASPLAMLAPEVALAYAVSSNALESGLHRGAGPPPGSKV
jgi:hypothetical protein